MAELLLELLSEESPARMQARAVVGRHLHTVAQQGAFFALPKERPGAAHK